MGRWIRARVVVTDRAGRRSVFSDVGAHELRKLKDKYKKVEIVSDDDWGRYLHPRNKTDEEEKKLMLKILKERKNVNT
jgi:hypothetical protein